MRSRRESLERSGFLLWVNHGEVHGADLIELRTRHAQTFFRDREIAQAVAVACTRAASCAAAADRGDDAV